MTVTINESCTACGTCHVECPVHAIDFVDGVSMIDQERCKGCGVCAAVCPVGAPQLQLDESVDVIADLTARIRSRTEIGV
ncbi:MAG: 4Fe-4S binding protein [Anaerolineales bacterium]|nr:4Fe-4S binding protein [Anaerolineales bacterium]